MTDVMTGGDETTTGVSETIGTADVSNAARSTITTGRARSARTPISLSETSATGAKHHDRVAVVDDGTTVKDGTTTEDSETTEADEGTTVKDGATTGVSETTEADEGTTVKDGTTTEDSETIGTAGANNAARTTTTTGHAPSARTPISPSERSATDAKHRDRVAVVAAEAVEEDNTETTVAQEATEISGEMANEDANRAVEAVVVASKIAVHPMFNPAEPKESVLVMLTINLPETSDLRGNLNAETTERMCADEC